eukprot:CAMPEP_0194362008 /NCGR_PEP_ID=MMETSP0174-20130528/9660_1 /TAXON_ID=216777 /ORGANISM="Proboscia alata, Strain PI-D3" /LENGTH=445 /DNA_ID=CAMNT_0039134567 /DNA_START=399 /DNA_END=1735 /DNA_ORIENTATION=+
MTKIDAVTTPVSSKTALGLGFDASYLEKECNPFTGDKDTSKEKVKTYLLPPNNTIGAVKKYVEGLNEKDEEKKKQEELAEVERLIRQLNVEITSRQIQMREAQDKRNNILAFLAKNNASPAATSPTFVETTSPSTICPPMIVGGNTTVIVPPSNPFIPLVNQDSPNAICSKCSKGIYRKRRMLNPVCKSCKARHKAAYKVERRRQIRMEKNGVQETAIIENTTKVPETTISQQVKIVHPSNVKSNEAVTTIVPTMSGSVYPPNITGSHTIPYFVSIVPVSKPVEPANTACSKCLKGIYRKRKMESPVCNECKSTHKKAYKSERRRQKRKMEMEMRKQQKTIIVKSEARDTISKIIGDNIEETNEKNSKDQQETKEKNLEDQQETSKNAIGDQQETKEENSEDEQETSKNEIEDQQETKETKYDDQQETNESDVDDNQDTNETASL